METRTISKMAEQGVVESEIYRIVAAARCILGRSALPGAGIDWQAAAAIKIALRANGYGDQVDRVAQWVRPGELKDLAQGFLGRCAEAGLLPEMPAPLAVRERGSIACTCSLRGLHSILRYHTSFLSFGELVHAAGGYSPSLNITDFPELIILADAYDLAQEIRGDRRRAFRF